MERQWITRSRRISGKGCSRCCNRMFYALQRLPFHHILHHRCHKPRSNYRPGKLPHTPVVPTRSVQAEPIRCRSISHSKYKKGVYPKAKGADESAGPHHLTPLISGIRVLIVKHEILLYRNIFRIRQGLYAPALCPKTGAAQRPGQIPGLPRSHPHL